MTIYRPSALLRENQLTGAPFLVHLLKGETNFYRQVSNGYHGNAFGTETGFCSRARIMVRAWCWKPVADRLRNAGHTVFPMSLTGLAERSHLLSDRITLETHVMDVVNLIKYNDLRDVVLVGHSYAGIVLTAVAERIPQCLRHIVYLDAMVPKPGECAMDLIPNDEAEQRVLRARHDGGLSIPAPTPGHFATEAMREWFRDHMTPQPIKPYFDRIDVRVPQGNGVPVTYVSCTPVKLHPIALSVERARRLPLWRVVEIASGHNVHLHRPDDVAEILMECAERA